MADDNRRGNKIPLSSSDLDPTSPSHSDTSKTAASSGFSVATQTNTNVSTRPFTDNSYKSRFSDQIPDGYKKPVRRKSVFVEELYLDSDTLDLSATPIPASSSNSQSR